MERPRSEFEALRVLCSEVSDNIASRIDGNEINLTRVIARSAEFKERIRREIHRAITQLGNEQMFSFEEVETHITNGSYCVKPHEVQYDILSEYFPALRVNGFPKRDAVLRDGTFLIPCPKSLGLSEAGALEGMIEALRSARKNAFYSWHDSCYGNDRFITTLRTDIALPKLSRLEGKLWEVTAQLGTVHRGRSARRTDHAMEPNEFGLTSYMVATVLITHGEILSSCDELAIMCGGDRVRNASGHYECVPTFSISDKKLIFGTCRESGAYPECGTATGYF